MTRFSYETTTGKVAASEVELIARPRPKDRAVKRGILLCHGAGQASVNQWSTPDTVPGCHALLMLLGNLGYYVLTCDLGGVYTFSNDTATNPATGRVLAAWNVLKTLGCATDKPIGLGVSMGFGNLMTAAGRGFSFAGIAGIVGLSDLDDVRDNNRGGLKSVVNVNGWGFPAAGTSATNPFPAYANPASNAANIAAHCPNVYSSYSTGDTTVLPATVTALVAALSGAGCTATAHVHGTQDHGDPSVLDAVTGANADALTAFLGACA